MAESIGSNGSTNRALVPQATPAGMVQRQEFGAHETQALAETSGSAAAARSKALVEAKFIMALQRPRDIDVVRDRLLKECKRPGFAEVARYCKPVGGGENAEDFSIRFMESAARCFGNLDINVIPVYEDAARRIIELTVLDLESNLSETVSLVIEKTVERRFADGREVISVRTNSKGKQTFLVKATEEEMFAKANAYISKGKRNCIKHVIPGDILEECKEQVFRTLENKDAQDPAAARKQIADAFSALGVSPADLKAYLGHPLDGCQPSELAKLRQLYQALKTGETTWREVMAAREVPAADEKKAATLDEKIEKKAQEAKPREEPPPAGEPPHNPGTGETHEPSEAERAMAIDEKLAKADTLPKLGKVDALIAELPEGELRLTLFAKAKMRRDSWGK
jgi:DNA-binding transcriptional MerR regulator